jgi:hypothetical protein
VLWFLAACAHPPQPPPLLDTPPIAWVGGLILVDDARLFDPATATWTTLLDGAGGVMLSPSGAKAAAVRGDRLVWGDVGGELHTRADAPVLGWWDERRLYLNDRGEMPPDSGDVGCRLLDPETGVEEPIACVETTFWAAHAVQGGASGQVWASHGEGNVAIDLVGAQGTASFILFPVGDLQASFDATGAVLTTRCHLEAEPHPCAGPEGEPWPDDAPLRMYRWDGGTSVRLLPGTLPAGAVSDGSGARSARVVDGKLCVREGASEPCFLLAVRD